MLRVARFEFSNTYTRVISLPPILSRILSLMADFLNIDLLIAGRGTRSTKVGRSVWLNINAAVFLTADPCLAWLGRNLLRYSFREPTVLSRGVSGARTCELTWRCEYERP
jgi:hypothetical protein